MPNVKGVAFADLNPQRSRVETNTGPSGKAITDAGR